MKRQTKAEKAADDRITKAYYRTCSGIQISVMDMGKVMHEGRKAVIGGANDDALGVAIRAYVETIRHN